MDFQYKEHGIAKNISYSWSNNFSNPRGRRFNSHAHFNSPCDDQNHWCETCDRGFRTAFLLDKHLKEHMTCSIDGCKFVAHPKVITKHIEMQHSTGLYNKIGNLSDPEAIAKWREERRKKYPTKQNIEKKQAELKEKFERGEKMGLKKREERFHEKGTKSKVDKRRDLHKQKVKRKPRCFKTNLTAAVSKTPTEIESEVRRLKPFQGIQSITLSESEDDNHDQMYEANDIEDDDVEIKITASNESAIVCSALSSLITNYDSLDEETSTNNDETCMKSNLNSSQVTGLLKNNTIASNNDDDVGPEEVKINKIVPDLLPNEQSRNISHTVKKSKNRFTPSHQRVYKRKLPSTLLEKLLSKEIRHERNVTLQCIRYIIKNSYFDEKNLDS